MPLPLATIIPAAASLVGQGINAISQGITNRQQRKYNEQAYQQQRKDSLADWNMQNKYNSPEQQMQRLQEAGLNPAMIYGKGTVDNFGGTVRSSDIKQYSPTPPRLDVGQAISQYADLELKKVQTDNIRAQREVTLQEAENKKIMNEILKNQAATGIFNLQKSQELFPYQLSMTQEGDRKLRAEVTSIFGSNERAWQVHDITKKTLLTEKLSQIALTQSQTENNKLNSAVIVATANKIIQEINQAKITNKQQIVLNDLLKDEKTVNNLLLGERVTTETFERKLKMANFTSQQIKDILNLAIPKRHTFKYQPKN